MKLANGQSSSSEPQATQKEIILLAVVIVWFSLLVLTATQSVWPFGLALLAILGMITSLFWSIIVHESAHAAVGALMGLRPVRVCVGHGPTLFEKRIKGTQWLLKAVPIFGHVLALGPDGNYRRTKLFLMVLAGPVTNMLLSVAVGFLIWDPPQWWAPFGLERRCFPLLPCLFAANVGIAVGNLIPRHFIRDGTSMQSDGLRLIRIPFLKDSDLDGQRAMAQYAHINELAQDRVQQALGQRTSDDVQNHPSLYWHWLLEEAKGMDLAPAFRSMLENSPSGSEGRNYLLDAFATWVLLEGATQHLPEAARYSEELSRNLPDSYSVKGTRGSILIEEGNVAEGMKLLSEVMDHDPNPFDRAICACFLALGELKQNRIPQAQHWLQTARSIDVNCVPIPRIEALLAQRSANA